MSATEVYILGLGGRRKECKQKQTKTPQEWKKTSLGKLYS